MNKEEVLKRFLEKYKVEENGCWTWLGNKLQKSGYGRMWFNRKQDYAHRVSFWLFKDTLLEDHYICHTCDNPSCVNPEHLYQGTPTDNTNDKVNRKRCNAKSGNAHWSREKPHLVKKGNRHSSAKLSDVQILEIREKYANGVIARRLAEEYAVSEGHMNNIVHRKVWTHI